MCGTVAEDELAIRATSLTTLALMVRSGLGATLLPASALEHEMAGAQDISLRSFETRSPHRTIGLIWRPTAVRIRLFRYLGECLQAIVPSLQRSIPQGIEGPQPAFQVCPMASVD